MKMFEKRSAVRIASTQEAFNKKMSEAFCVMLRTEKISVHTTRISDSNSNMNMYKVSQKKSGK